MKKMALILALLIMLSLFGACDNGSDTASEAPESTAPAQEETQAPDDGEDEPDDAGEASVYPLSDGTFEITATLPIGGHISGYITKASDFYSVNLAEQATGVVVDASFVDQDAYSEIINIQLNSGDYTDIYVKAEEYYSTGIDGLVDDGICRDLSQFINEYMPAYSSLLEEYPIFAKNSKSSSGAIITIGTKQTLMSMGPQIRKDWLDELEMEIPQTYDELTEVLRAFKTEYNCTDSVILSYRGSVSYLAGGYGTSGYDDTDLTWYVDDDGGVHMSYVEDGFIEYIDMLRSWYEEGLYSSDFLSIMNSFQLNPYLMSEQSGFSPYAGTDLLGDVMAAELGNDCLMVAMPDVTKTAGETITLGLDERNDVQFGWTVTTAVEESDLETVLRYIDWFYTEEGQIATNFGEQGVTFDIDANGDKYYTDIIMNNEEIPMVGATRDIYTLSTSFPMILLGEKDFLTTSNDHQVECYDLWTSNRTDANVYYGMLNAEENTLYGNLTGDMLTMCNETILAYITGQSTKDAYMAMIDTLYEMGLQQVIDVKQAAYDRWVG